MYFPLGRKFPEFLANWRKFHGLVDAIGLDYYHLRDYVQRTRLAVYGEQAAEGQAWREEVMGLFYERGFSEAQTRLLSWRKSLRGGKRAAADRLLQYIEERQAMIAYPQFRERGWQIGSGPTEAQCKSTTQRLKGRGRRWDKTNAEALMALDCLDSSAAWQQYWLIPSPGKNLTPPESLGRHAFSFSLFCFSSPHRRAKLNLSRVGFSSCFILRLRIRQAMLFVLEIAMTVLGIVTLAKGRAEFIGGKVVRGAPAYVVGALLAFTWPLVFVAALAANLIAASQEWNYQDSYFPLAVEIAGIGGIAIASFVIMATAAKEPVLQFSLQTLMIVMAMVAVVLGVYRGVGWQWLAYYYLLVFAVGPWFAYLVSECLPIRPVHLRIAAGHLLLLLLFIGALKICETLIDGQVVLLVGLAALLLWTPQYMVFFVWRGSLES